MSLAWRIRSRAGWAKALAAILVPALAPGFAQPCADYACDSSVVRLILDLNGGQDKAVASVSADSAGRIAKLSLQYLGIDTLPPEAGRLSALTHLGLDRNGLTSLPAEIGRLTSLVSLYLDNNRLVSLPEEMGDLASLRWLILFQNDLASVPAGIGRLTALTLLRLEDNRLTGLPPEIRRLSPADGLQIGNNRLCALPDSLETWVNAFSGDPDWKRTQTSDGLNACPLLSITPVLFSGARGNIVRKSEGFYFLVPGSVARGQGRWYGLRGNRIQEPPVRE